MREISGRIEQTGARCSFGMDSLILLHKRLRDDSLPIPGGLNGNENMENKCPRGPCNFGKEIIDRAHGSVQ
jgi:hypothetical protein